ncbi:MAG: MMPL family transporter [Solirubrobacterales bacterium]
MILAACCITTLAVAGLNAEGKLHQTSLSVPGTESARTETLLHHYFGSSETFIVLLRGPRKQVRRQGLQLVRALNRHPQATAFSPWGREAVDQLRPSRRSAVIFVRFRVDLDEAVQRTVPYLNRLLKRRISPPVRAIQTGYASVSRAIQDEAASATQRGELIAIPLVLLVLLVVFRSPIAAAIPLAFGGATVVASRGILSIAADWLSIDAFALTASAMMGLALGVDYTLLMVSRFREELAAGKTPMIAARATRQTAGRTIAFAGGALLVSMAVSALILPGTFLVSLAGAVVVVTGLSVVLGLIVVPPLLVLIGHRINRLSLGTAPKQQRWPGLVDSVLRRPGVVAAALAVPLMMLALPAMSLSVGPPNPDQLPPSNRARLNSELINTEVGPGWAAPYVVLAATDSGAITSRKRLAVVRRWEQSLKAANDVQAVIGPGSIAGQIKPLGKAGKSLLAQDKAGSQASELQRLGSRLDSAAEGAGALQNGLSQAANGAGLLSEGSQRLERGSHLLAGDLASASSGGARAVQALDRFAAGTHDIRRGQHRAAFGALAVKYDIRDLIPRLRHSTLLPSRLLQRDLSEMQTVIPHLETGTREADDQLNFALQEFHAMADPPEDPSFSSAVKAVEAAQFAIAGDSGLVARGDEGGVAEELGQFGSELAHASDHAGEVTSGVRGRLRELREARTQARRLVDGLVRLERGGQAVDSGAHQLAGSASRLIEGLPRLSGGAAALSTGTEQLSLGTFSLARHLNEIHALSRSLEPGLSRAAEQSTTSGLSLRSQSRLLRRLSPGFINSGYFNLAALDGTSPGHHSTVGQTVDLDHGGQAARILVIPRYTHPTRLDYRLRSDVGKLARQIGGAAGVAGAPAEVADYSRSSKSRLPIVIAVVSLLTFLSLMLVLRAVLASLITVFLNLLSVAVAFGALAMMSVLPNGSPIGHWGYIDTIGAVAIFAIAFGVSIDYSVFILVRMREEFDRNGQHDAAVKVGVQRTGRVITGAALMMVIVFAVFATSKLAIVGQLGAGLAIAILMDATIIRLLLLPALLLIVGERAWWIPEPIDRLVRGARPHLGRTV